ncbi:dTDP-4-dehydrorhamnose reductase [candidate division KSB1 bacterium]|nr:dTDP-4-dehydrorhamnose reductase [candidate division KSB1 bacterium]
MRIVICGCNGLLGQKLMQAAPSAAEVMGFDLQRQLVSQAGHGYKRLDITDRRALTGTIKAFAPDWIINAAAYNNVDGAESERELCWQINVKAVENLAYACRKAHARLVHVSTDYVFDGKEGPYDEEAVPNPIGFYGRSKLAGENVLRLAGIDFAIARTMVLYGRAQGVRPNFVTWLIARLQAGEGATIVTDQYGNTTLSDELAAGLWAIVAKAKTGILNIAGREIIDRYHFALKIAEIFHLDAGLISPIATAQLVQAAPRPMRSGLVVDKALRELNIELSDVAGGLQKLKKQYGSDLSGSQT